MRMDQEPDLDEPHEPTREEQEDDAWEYWHQRARKFEAALFLIAQMEGKTLIAPSRGDDFDIAHQVGANKAFNQAADIAKTALASTRATMAAVSTAQDKHG